MELVNYQMHANEFYVRQARTILQERGYNDIVHQALKKILIQNPDVTRRLRALWTLHVTDGLTEEYLANLLIDSNEYIRSWAIQLLTEDKDVSEAILERFKSLAENDNSALVRLYLVSGLLRLDTNKRWHVLEALTQRSEDAEDHNLPLMLWYAAEPLATIDSERLLKMAKNAKIPIFKTYVERRIGELKQ